jgi:hypothetical protein
VALDADVLALVPAGDLVATGEGAGPVVEDGVVGEGVEETSLSPRFVASTIARIGRGSCVIARAPGGCVWRL